MFYNKIILITFRKYEMIFEVQNVLLCKTNVICGHRMDRSGQRGSLYRYFSTLIDFKQFKREMIKQIPLIDWPVRFPGCIKNVLPKSQSCLAFLGMFFRCYVYFGYKFDKQKQKKRRVILSPVIRKRTEF